jgi:hypothetical protein
VFLFNVDCLIKGMAGKAAWSKAWVCGRLLAGIAGSNSAGSMDVSCECCVLSCTGLCHGLITRSEESYRLCVCVCVCVCVTEYDQVQQ